MDGDSRPVPDPTLLTTEQLLREIAHAREIDTAERAAMRELFTEKFDALERHRVEQKHDDRRALDAAFAAAKEETGGVKVILNDLKDRVITIESNKTGGTEARSALYALVGFIVSLVVIGGYVAALSK